MNVQNVQRNGIWHFGVWYFGKMAFWNILVYIFSIFFNVGYDFLKLTGVKRPGRNIRGAKLPMGETTEGRKVHLSAQVIPVSQATLGYHTEVSLEC